MQDMSKNKRRASWGLIILAWLLCNFFTLHFSWSIFDDLPVAPIQQAELHITSSSLPLEINPQQWEAVLLPDDWLANDRNTTQAWYKLRFNYTPAENAAPPGNEPWAIYISHVTHNVGIYLNGLWIGQSGDLGPPISRHHNEPQLFEFSPKLLQHGENEFLLRIQAAYKKYGLLDAVHIAPVSTLKPAYDFKYFVRVTLVQWLTIVMTLMGLTVLIFFAVRPQDKIYGFFSAELFLWSAHNLNLFVHNIPVSTRLWEAMTMATLGWTVVLMVFFNHRFIGVPNKFVERSMLLFATLGIGLYFLPDVEKVFYIGYKIWDVILVIFGSYAIGYLLVRHWRNASTDTLLMILAGIPILAFGLHDILLVNGFRPRTEGLIIQYSALPALIVFSWFIIKRFIQSINRAEDLSKNLEQKVKAKEKELQEQYLHLQQLEQEKILSEERERIMRDMHDGIGSQLVSVVGALGSSTDERLVDVREKIKTSLADLRMVIDSLDPAHNNLATLLATLRQHFEESLRYAGISLVWDIEFLPETLTSAQQNIHILRIVQEAMTNAIKHAECSQVRLQTRCITRVAPLLEICVEDNGKGFEHRHNDASQASRGLQNMRYRAKQIGAELNVKSGSTGTAVCLLLGDEASANFPL